MPLNLYNIYMTLTINRKNHTIEMPTKKYASAASKYGSDEYKEVQAAHADYPNFKVVTRKSAKRHDNLKGLTYEVMETYIADLLFNEKSKRTLQRKLIVV